MSDPKLQKSVFYLQWQQLPNYNMARTPFSIDLNLLLPETLRIINADQNKINYEVIFDQTSPEDMKIWFDNETRFLFCEAVKDGDYKFELRICQMKSDTEISYVLPLSLSAIPDPKNLWKDIPVPSSDPYFKSDSDTNLINCPGSITLTAASKRGRSHAHYGRFREDDFAIYYDEANEYSVMIISDGAGSANFSRKGSSLAVAASLGWIKQTADQHFWMKLSSLVNNSVEDVSKYSSKISELLQYCLVQAAIEARKSIIQEADDLNKDPDKRSALGISGDTQKNVLLTEKDFACTLIIVLVKKIEKKWFVASFWIGDGGVGILDSKNNSVIVQGSPDVGSYSGETRFLTMREVWGDAMDCITSKRVHYDIVNQFTSIILMSDGISDALFESENHLKQVACWQAMWDDLSRNVNFGSRDASVPQGLLKWLDFWSTGNHDDRTIVMLY